MPGIIPSLHVAFAVGLFITAGAAWALNGASGGWVVWGALLCLWWLVFASRFPFRGEAVVLAGFLTLGTLGFVIAAIVKASLPLV